MISLSNQVQRIAQGAIVLAGVVTAGLIGMGRLPPPRAHSTAARPSNEGLDSSETQFIFAGGVVEGVDREIPLRFEVAGRVKKVLVREGENVKAGQVLAELETDVAELLLQEAQLRHRLAVAERDRNRSASQRLTRDAARASYVAADPRGSDADLTIEGNVELAETVVRRQQLMFEKCALRAPMDGIVLQTTVQAGELVGSPTDQPVIMLTDRRETRVRAFVEELDALDVQPGQSAVVRLVGKPERSYRATVVNCSPYVHPKSHRHLRPGERLDVRMREVVVEVERASELLTGLPVEVHISAKS